MIKGDNKNNNESAYREITLDSSSSLKDFLLDRKKYYRKYILHEEVEDKDSQAIIMGKLVETLLMEPEQFDNRFHMSACMSAPTGLMLEFVEALYQVTKEATDEDGIVTRDFSELSKDAYMKSGFKISLDQVIKKFQGSDAEIYYNEIRLVRSNNLTVVTTQDVDNAERIVEELRTNPVTANLVNLTSSGRYKVINQAQVENYEVEGMMFKSMMDKVVIDHQRGTIQVYDLKCVWAVENFFEEYYLYRRAYIQAYLYYMAAHQLMRTDSDFDSEPYNVLPPCFIVCDSTNYYNPLIYKLTHEDITEAREGFEFKGRYYKGVSEIIQDLKWALDNNTWNISRENYLSNGIVKLKKND